MLPSGRSDIASVLATRHDVLRAVGDEGARKNELTDALDVSRSTVDRAVRELEEADLLAREAGRCRRTLAGNLALAEYDGYRRRLDGIVDGRELLAVLPPDARFDARVLADADIRVTEAHAPYESVSPVSDLIERATRTRTVASGVIPQQVETYRRAILEDGLEAQFVVTDRVIEHVIETYDDALSEALATGRVEFRLTDEPMPYSVVVAETPDGTRVGVLVYGDAGVRGTVRNDDPAAVAWGLDLFERFWERAAPLSPPK